jgi:hypothetical protein
VRRISTGLHELGDKRGPPVWIRVAVEFRHPADLPQPTPCRGVTR